MLISTASTTLTIRERIIRGTVIASLIFAFQTFGSAPKAEASTLGNVYEAVSTAVAYDLGTKACGLACGAAAAAATVVVNENATQVASSGASATKSRLQSIFGFWGFH